MLYPPSHLPSLMLICDGEERHVPGASGANSAELWAPGSVRDSALKTVRWRAVRKDTQCQPLATTCTHKCNMHTTNTYKANTSHRQLPSSSTLESVLSSLWWPNTRCLVYGEPNHTLDSLVQKKDVPRCLHKNGDSSDAIFKLPSPFCFLQHHYQEV